MPESKTVRDVQKLYAAILFFDIAPESSPNDLVLTAISTEVLPALYSEIEDTVENKIKLDQHSRIFSKNAWGDSIFLISDSALIIGHISLEISQYFIKQSYSTILALKNITLRCHISINIGTILEFEDPFRKVEDQINKVSGYFGWEIVKCARIKPICEPNKVWVTKKYMDQVVDDQRSLDIIQGKLTFSKQPQKLVLDKDYGECEVWEMNK